MKTLEVVDVKRHIGGRVTVSLMDSDGKIQRCVIGNKRATLLGLCIGDHVEYSRHPRKGVWIERVLVERRPIDCLPLTA